MATDTEYVLVGGKYVYEKLEDFKDARGKEYVSVRAVQRPYLIYETYVPANKCQALDILEAFGRLARQQETKS